MGFRKEMRVLSRLKLRKGIFYEDVTFENKEVRQNARETIEKWIFDLAKMRQVEVEKFKDLFSGLPEMTFPIKIKDVRKSKLRGFDIEILDYEEKEYYIWKRDYYSDIEGYIVGRKDSRLEPLIDRDFHYKICEDNTILLLGTGATKLNPDGIDDDITVHFYYDYQNHTTEANLRSFASNSVIKMQYPTMGSEFDKKVLEFLFQVEEANWYYYDVFPILKWMLLTLSAEEVSLSITAEVERKISSEIDIVRGTVQKYTKTEVISEGELHINKTIFAKKLEDFLAERS